MALLSPPPNRFTAVYSNCLTTRPGTSYGTSLTPGNNTYPGFVDLMGGTTPYDTYWMDIIVHGVGAAAAAKNALLNIGFDFAGGTTYTDRTINHLLVSCANNASNAGVMGARYSFPLYIPAGTRVGGAGSVNNATVGSMRVAIKLHGKPSRPGLVRAGSYVDTFGATPASSSGTVMTPGTTAEGSWTLLQSGLSNSYWWWECGFGVNDSTMTGGNTYATDIGVGTSTSAVDPIYEDMMFCTVNTSEMVAHSLLASHEYIADIPASGSLNVYGRMQCSGTSDSAISMAVYALGG
jgi:hypothetical protein